MSECFGDTSATDNSRRVGEELAYGTPLIISSVFVAVTIFLVLIET